jgi:hypothetical protein
MAHLRRVLISVLSAAALAGGVLLTNPVGAAAYGNTALYQAGESLNCDNPSFPLCAPPPHGFGLGGIWAWWEFDAGNTGDATVTFCGHTTGGAGTFGAQSIRLDIEHWSLGPALPGDVDFPGGVNFYVDLAEWTVEGRQDGSPPVTFEAYFGDTGIPVIPGHYSFHPAPGVAGEVQVVTIPNP